MGIPQLEHPLVGEGPLVGGGAALAVGRQQILPHLTAAQAQVQRGEQVQLPEAAQDRLQLRLTQGRDGRRYHDRRVGAVSSAYSKATGARPSP
jgi:hypothetical protein